MPNHPHTPPPAPSAPTSRSSVPPTVPPNRPVPRPAPTPAPKSGAVSWDAFKVIVIGTVAALLAALGYVLTSGGGVANDGGAKGEGATQSAPVSHEKYKNGELPHSALTSIGNGHQLAKKPAKAFKKLAKALKAAGHDYAVNSAYRSLDEQKDLVAKLGTLDDGGRAAKVGTSEHGLGTAVDMTLSWEAVEWLRANAGKYGFKETISEEPWHWAYVN